MGKLRRGFDRFCLRNRNKGIPNLMLYIALGNAVVTLLSMFNGGSILYSLLCFDKALILKGEVWRLLTYVFTQSGNDLFSLLFLFFFYLLGRHVEQSMGTLRFNLYYFTGVILMDAFAMIFADSATASLYLQMGYYLHLSLLLTFASLHPDAQFMILMLFPVRAWVLGLVYALLVTSDIFNLSYPIFWFPHNLFPLIGVANFLLFAGSNVKNLLPPAWRRPKRPKTPHKHEDPIPFRPTQRPAPQREDFSHKCTVCGRTDVTNPELEFRYCSRCSGYHCYCEDHINNHTHI